MSEFQTVSHSEAEAWLQCQRRWLYGYSWGLTKKQHGTALSRGTAGHRVLQVFYQALLDGAPMTSAWELAMAELVALEAAGNTGDNPKDLELRTILDYYFDDEPFAMRGYEILAVEQEFVVEYEDGVGMPMFIDLIVRDPQGKVAVVDHKFQYDFLTEANMRVMPQIVKYIGSIRALGLPADYAIYNQLRYRKKKDLTRADVVRQSPFVPSPQRVVRTFKEQAITASNILAFKELSREEQDERATRVGVKMICQSCSFKDLCGEDLEGGNVRVVIENEYEQKQRRQFKPSEIPEE